MAKQQVQITPLLDDVFLPFMTPKLIEFDIDEKYLQKFQIHVVGFVEAFKESLLEHLNFVRFSHTRSYYFHLSGNVWVKSKQKGFKCSWNVQQSIPQESAPNTSVSSIIEEFSDLCSSISKLFHGESRPNGSAELETVSSILKGLPRELRENPSIKNLPLRFSFEPPSPPVSDVKIADN